MKTVDNDAAETKHPVVMGPNTPLPATCILSWFLTVRRVQQIFIN